MADASGEITCNNKSRGNEVRQTSFRFCCWCPCNVEEMDEDCFQEFADEIKARVCIGRATGNNNFQSRDILKQ